MAEQVLVFVEHDGNEIGAITRQLVTRGREQAGRLNAQLGALVLGHQVEGIVQSVSEMDLDVVFVADDSSFESYNPEVYTRAVAEILGDIAPRAVLLGDTYMTREVGPAVALRLGIPFLSSCVDLELSETKAMVTQPKYGGVINVRAELEPMPPSILISLQSSPDFPDTVRSHIPSVVPLKVKVDTQGLRTRVVDVVLETDVEFDITKADIVVAGGRGLGTKENVSLIEELAQALGGVVACSRPLWDIGWLPSSRVVGMSGKTITPRVYIACGISGAPQHIVGMSGAKCIIAINKDVNAPMFRLAHYAVVGDLCEFLPAIIDKARSAKADSKHVGG